MKYVTPETEIMDFEAMSVCCTLGVSNPEDFNSPIIGDAPDEWEQP